MPNQTSTFYLSYGTNNINFRNDNFGEILRLSNNGAATFSSSVTAGGNISYTSGSAFYPRTTSVTNWYLQKHNAAIDRIDNAVGNNNAYTFGIDSGGTYTPNIFLYSGGSATFSSSVTANARSFIKGSAGYLFDVEEQGSNKARFQSYVASNEVSLVAGYDTTAVPMTFYTGNAERMRIFSDGNVLIQSGGTFSNAGFKLDVNGSLRAGGPITSSQGYTFPNGIINVTGGSPSWVNLGTISLAQGGNTAVITIEGGSGFNASESQNASARIFIRTSNGSPNGSGWFFSATLTQTGFSDAFISDCIITQTNSTTFNVFVRGGSFLGNSYYKVEGSAFTWTASNSDFGATAPSGGLTLTKVFNVISTATFASSISAGGDVIAFASSDRRLKDNLTRIESSLEKVGKLSGYSFDWNSNQETYSGKDYGVVAQEVEAIFPELVKTRDNGYKAVKYEKLIPVLIEAIKELNEKVEKLK
jgi:hypothetical protein